MMVDTIPLGCTSVKLQPANPLLQIIWYGRSDLKRPLRRGMKEPKCVGVQQWMHNAKRRPEERWATAVGRITQDGIPQMRHVDANLVCASGFERDIKQRIKERGRGARGEGRGMSTRIPCPLSPVPCPKSL